jgi:plasmid stability protein
MQLTLELDEDLHGSLERRAETHGFESTEEYCRTILQAVVEELEGDATDDEVEERLEDLGYLS